MRASGPRPQGHLAVCNSPAGQLSSLLQGAPPGGRRRWQRWYGGRWLGGEYADATDPKKDFAEAAKPAPYTPSKMSASFDPSIFKNAPATQSAFSGAVKPAGIDVTKVAEPDMNAVNNPQFKRTAQSYHYN